IERQRPNYRQLSPASYPNRLVVGKAPLLDALRRVKLLALEATPVRLSLRPDGLELTAIAQEVGQAREEVDAKYEGGELVVAFNPEFLIARPEAVERHEVALASFRGAPHDALVREGRERAIVRAEIDRSPESRRSTIEAELATAGRDRVLVNRQPLRRAGDLLGALRVVVFSPDDLALVKGGPAERRRYLDDTMVAVDSRLDAVRDEFDRVLRQRNALLR